MGNDKGGDAIVRISLDNAVYVVSWLAVQGGCNVALIGAPGVGKTSALRSALRSILGEGNLSFIKMAVVEPQSIHGIVGSNERGEARLFRHSKILRLDPTHNENVEGAKRDPFKPVCIFCDELNVAPPQTLSAALSGLGVSSHIPDRYAIFDLEKKDLVYTHCSLIATMNDQMSNPLARHLPEPWSRRLVQFWIKSEISDDYFDAEIIRASRLISRLVEDKAKDLPAVYRGDLRGDPELPGISFPMVPNLVVEAYKSIWLEEMASWTLNNPIKPLADQVDFLEKCGGLINYDNPASRENCALAMAALTANVFCGDIAQHPALSRIRGSFDSIVEALAIAAIGPLSGRRFAKHIQNNGVLKRCEDAAPEIQDRVLSFIGKTSEMYGKREAQSAIYADPIPARKAEAALRMR